MKRVYIIRRGPDPSEVEGRWTYEVEEIKYDLAEGGFRVLLRPGIKLTRAYCPGEGILPVGTIVRARSPLPTEEGLGDIIIIEGVSDAIIQQVSTHP